MSSIELGSTIVDALVGMGVSDVVLAPGSRNAALALALDRADKAGALRLHVRVDERVAGFTALGLAKASGRAVAVVTTSGTAVANLGPAAMEANAAGVPLVFITADRPAHYVGTGASQTADQVGVFGPSALAVVRVSSESGGPGAWAAAMHRAVVTAEGRRTRRPGPVQVNAEFGAPIVGELPEAAPRSLDVATSARASLVDLDSRPTVVLVGDANPAVGAEARALAEASGAPLFAEPSSNARVGANAIAAYRELVGSDLGRGIERVVCFGHPTLSRPVTRMLFRDDIELVVVTSTAVWTDVGSRASIVADAVVVGEQEPGWLERWRSADAALAVDETWGQRAVADAVLKSLGTGDDLMIGSSSIVRALDLSPVQPAPPRTFANRGLAGIDGTVSTATGIALASGRPMTVLLGDLTLQHDLGALARPAQEPAARVRIVVADDNGGSIFHTLEQGAPAYAESFERVFGTPQGLDLAAIAAAMGWSTARADSAQSLADALASDAEFIVATVSRGGAPGTGR